MNFQRRWIREDLPTETITRPRDPYVESTTIVVNEGQDLDIDLQQYVRQSPQVIESY